MLYTVYMVLTWDSKQNTVICLMNTFCVSSSYITSLCIFIDSEPRDLVLDRTVTGIVGEDVYLHCMYTGQSKILFSSWNRLDSSNRVKKRAGYHYGNTPFSKENFGLPASITNLTVKMSITGLEVEGEYTCVFNSDEDETKGTMFLSVIGEYQMK